MNICPPPIIDLPVPLLFIITNVVESILDEKTLNTIMHFSTMNETLYVPTKEPLEKILTNIYMYVNTLRKI